ncbi:MAG: hypothetical protein ACI8QZ_003441 [Chlamydiales bacterium]|jgi:hypothetical protein
MTPRHRLTRAIVRLILLAAILSAPVFLVAEEFDARHSLIVLASNGVCAALCVLLLWRLRLGQVDLAARVLVWGLLILVATLASTNGEGVHVNVVNFILVTVLASVLLGRRALLAIAGFSACTMLSIAWRQALPAGGEELFEYRLETIAQFLPTYLVVVAILWLREGGATEPVTPGPDGPQR